MHLCPAESENPNIAVFISTTTHRLRVGILRSRWGGRNTKGELLDRDHVTALQHSWDLYSGWRTLKPTPFPSRPISQVLSHRTPNPPPVLHSKGSGMTTNAPPSKIQLRCTFFISERGLVFICTHRLNKSWSQQSTCKFWSITTCLPLPQR